MPWRLRVALRRHDLASQIEVCHACLLCSARPRLGIAVHEARSHLELARCKRTRCEEHWRQRGLSRPPIRLHHVPAGVGKSVQRPNTSPTPCGANQHCKRGRGRRPRTDRQEAVYVLFNLVVSSLCFFLVLVAHLPAKLSRQHLLVIGCRRQAAGCRCRCDC